ncbi:MAG: RluA family pseudouridine synthase [Alphaproteobacteria bacterium]|nr:RluA family pseudouridine synthase [Alphaproteobacteria bacterium]
MDEDESEEEEVGTATATLDAPGARLDRALADAFPALSRSRLKALIEEGRVRLGGVPATSPAQKLTGPVEARLELPPPLEAVPVPEDIPLDILFEDDHLVVIDKPAGLVVHPGAGHHSGTLVNALLHHCGGSLSGIGGVARPGIVHRLDRETSGIMVIAKTDAAHRALAGAFESRSIERVYIAFVRGVPAHPEGEIEGAIGRSPRNRQKMAVLERGGKPALTLYRVEARYGPPTAPMAARVACRLMTGRTHQIRVHLAHIGHAVIGDPLYGQGSGRTSGLPKGAAREAIATFPRQALHAARLGFTHPATGEALLFERPLPADMAALARALATQEPH